MNGEWDARIRNATPVDGQGEHWFATEEDYQSQFIEPIKALIADARREAVDDGSGMYLVYYNGKKIGGLTHEAILRIQSDKDFYAWEYEPESRYTQKGEEV